MRAISSAVTVYGAIGNMAGDFSQVRCTTCNNITSHCTTLRIMKLYLNMSLYRKAQPRKTVIPHSTAYNPHTPLVVTSLNMQVFTSVATSVFAELQKDRHQPQVRSAAISASTHPRKPFVLIYLFSFRLHHAYLSLQWPTW